MTSNHLRAAWTASLAGSFESGILNYGARRNKGYPFANFDSSFLQPHNQFPIRPYVMGPNLYSADQWGVSFPAGLVMVLVSFASVGTGDFDTRLKAWIDFQNAATPFPGFAFYLVPGVLPSGYTPNLTTPWVVSNTSSGPMTPANAMFYVGDKDGWTLQSWLPTVSPWGTSNFTNVTYSTTTDAWVSMSGTGWRSIQVRGFVSGGTLPIPSGSGDFTLTATHNADGSNPGNADGDTSDWSTSYSAGDWADIGGSIATPWTTVGSALATRGKSTTVFNIKSTKGAAAFSYPGQLQFRLSPRLDVPFPMTITGEGDLIAPGGTP